jgi:hypothetical protein
MLVYLELEGLGEELGELEGVGGWMSVGLELGVGHLSSFSMENIVTGQIGNLGQRDLGENSEGIHMNIHYHLILPTDHTEVALLSPPPSPFIHHKMSLLSYSISVDRMEVSPFFLFFRFYSKKKYTQIFV